MSQPYIAEREKVREWIRLHRRIAAQLIADNEFEKAGQEQLLIRQAEELLEQARTGKLDQHPNAIQSETYE